MRAAILDGKGNIRIGEAPMPRLGRGGAILRVTAVGICGSDLVKFGGAPAGTILGHEVAGVVERVGAGVSRFHPGDRITSAHHVPCGRCVYCRGGNESQCAFFRSTNIRPGGWTEFIALSARHLEKVTFRIPRNLSDGVASLTEPLGCAVRAVRRAGARRGDTFVVIGLGPVGILIAALFVRKGVSVFLLDRSAKRTRIAAGLSGAVALRPSPGGALHRTLRATGGRGADQVILCAGAPSTLALALRLVRRGGKVHLFSGVPGGTGVEVDVNSIYKREVELFSTYSSTPADLAAAFRLIRRREVPAAGLISHTLPLSRIGTGIDLIRRGEALKVILDPSR